MSKIEFSALLQKFLLNYLVNDKGCTAATTESDKLGFRSLIRYYTNTKNINLKKLNFDCFNAKSIKEYYTWMEESCNNSINTRNHRQAVINSFAKFVINERPHLIKNMQEILSIPKKKHTIAEVRYLKIESVKALLESIDRHSLKGERDFLMVSLLFTTGIRVSELISINVEDISLEDPATILIHGKGRKNRYVPILSYLKKPFENFLVTRRKQKGVSLDSPVFVNHSNNRFTRQGIAYVIKKYASKVRTKNPALIPFEISPHTMRHSAAMGMLDSGIDLMTIKTFLGHENITTTEIYAKADAKEKAEAISAHVQSLMPEEEPIWKKASGWEWILK